MRLQKYLASCGVASRRASEKMIAEGRVSVDGTVITEMGTKVEDGQIVCVDGKPVTPEAQKYAVYIGVFAVICLAYIIFRYARKKYRENI